MDTNRYAPPLAAVADLTEAALPARRSAIAVIVSMNAGIFGALLSIAGVRLAIRQSVEGIPFTGLAVIACLFLLALTAAIGLFRQRRWAAILWCVLCGVLTVLSLLGVLAESRAEYGIVVFFAVQFAGSLLGLWAIVRKRSLVKAPAIK